MSRRHRTEIQKAKDVKNEEDEDEDKIKTQRERIYAPLVWLRRADGIKIQDLKETYFEEVLEMFKVYYIPEEVLCNNTDMQHDEESVEWFLKRLHFNMRDSASIVAVHEYVRPKVVNRNEDECGPSSANEPNETKTEDDNTEANQEEKKEEKEVVVQDIAGCLIIKATNKGNFGRIFSRVQLTEGEALKKCVAIKNHLNRKVDIYAKFNCECFLRYYALCIKPEYRKRGLGMDFFKSGLHLARAMKIPVVMGLFTDYKIQKLAKRIGMQVVQEINYVDWRDSQGELIFEDPGAGNYTCAVMAGEVPPPPPPVPTKHELSEEKEKPVKKTRNEKRAAKGKN